MKIKKLIGCARCGNEHENLKFIKLKRAVLSWNGLVKETIFTHYCLCPKNGQPIMLKTIK